MRRFLLSLLLAFAGLAAALAQTPSPVGPPATEKPALEILQFKVGSDHYPLLDRQGAMTMTADNPDFPRPEAERAQQRAGRRGDFRVRTEDTKARGKLRSNVKVIDEAQWVQVTVKNSGAKTIKAVEWDFAFPRLVNGQTALRFDVSSQVEIKPGKKKTLKQALPPGARGCEMMVVRAGAGGVAQAGYYGGVCGHPLAMRDPAATNQEAATIKRVEYADGSVWVRP
jgi:hypothetical protein